MPGSHPTIQSAIDDLACTQIQLADQTFVEDLVVDHSVVLSGANPGNSTLQGQIGAFGLGSLVAINALRVENGCGPIGVQSVQGARIEGIALVVANVTALPCDPDFIFYDGFEVLMP